MYICVCLSSICLFLCFYLCFYLFLCIIYLCFHVSIYHVSSIYVSIMYVCIYLSVYLTPLGSGNSQDSSRTRFMMRSWLTTDANKPRGLLPASWTPRRADGVHVSLRAEEDRRPSLKTVRERQRERERGLSRDPLLFSQAASQQIRGAVGTTHTGEGRLPYLVSPFKCWSDPETPSQNYPESCVTSLWAPCGPAKLTHTIPVSLENPRTQTRRQAEPWQMLRIFPARGERVSLTPETASFQRHTPPHV